MAQSSAVRLLEAVQLTTEADIDGLRKLVGACSSVFSNELVLQLLLTYLPESTDPKLYIGFVSDLIQGNFSGLDNDEPTLRIEAKLKEGQAELKAREIRLLPISQRHRGFSESANDLLAGFVLERVRKIDAETGSFFLAQELLDAFSAQSKALESWVATVFLPFIRLEYEFYPRDNQVLTLDSFEGHSGESGLENLLSEIFSRRNKHDNENWGRDFRFIVCPWIYGEAQNISNSQHDPALMTVKDDDATSGPNPKDLWNQLNTWLLELAKNDLDAASAIIQQWEGPGDINFSGLLETPSHRPENLYPDYSQTVLSMVYLQRQSFHPSGWNNYTSLLETSARISQLDVPTDFSSIDLSSSVTSVGESFLTSISTVHILPSELLERSNPLTCPTSQSLNLAFLTLSSSYLLSTLGEDLSPDVALSLCLYGFEADQRTRLQKVLHRLVLDTRKDDTFWRQTREKILWLRSWKPSDPKTKPRQALFGRLSYVEVEIELLKTFTTAGRFELVNDTYIGSNAPLQLTEDKVEKSILDVAFSFYDNASNGNKTRGGIKKVSEIVSTFKPKFPASLEFARIQALVQATHSLSFYSLTLQHGVPFIPVNIRVHPSPLSLIEKVLSQNTKSYTKLDDLLEIGRNLVKSGLVHRSEDEDHLQPRTEEEKLLLVERQIIAWAIGAALKEDDFDTAYSYITSRLSPSDYMPQDAMSQAMQPEDAVLWQAAYEAGRYTSGNSSGPSEIRRLEQRMELLSQALLIAPPSSLQEVLGTWRECEDEINILLAQESEEEEKWNEMGDRHLPGGFTGEDVVPTPRKPRNATRRAMEEDAPMGLFDVARGAASAFSKSAFPLRGQAATSAQTRGSPLASPTSSQGETNEYGERVRKRDMVSNMVTGGLKSGIGWVIGARSEDMQ